MIIYIDNKTFKKSNIKNLYVTFNGDIAKIKLNKDNSIKSYYLYEWQKSKSGYARIEYKDRKYLVHRLVYETWSNDKLNPELVIDHIDGNPVNINIDNLRQVTQKENILNGLEHGNFGHNHNTKIKVYDDILKETKYYNSIKEFYIDIGAPCYFIKNGGLGCLNKKKEYNRYHVIKIDEHQTTIES